MNKLSMHVVRLSFAALLFGGAIARGQGWHTWDGGSGTEGKWSVSTNWLGDVVPGNPTANILNFAGTTRLSNTADVPWTVWGLFISNNAGGFIINGSDLTLTANCFTDVNISNVFTHAGPSNVIINNRIILPTTVAHRRQFKINGAGGVTFNGAITNTGTDNSELWIRGAGSGVGTINGRVTIGTNKVFRTDNNITWVIGSTNNIWGVTELDNTGTLRIAAADALPTNTLVQFDSGVPRLDLNNFNQTVRGLTGVGMVRLGTGAGSTLTISDLGTTNTFPGFFVENGRLVKTGPGRTILTSTNGTTMTGNVVVAEGVLQAGNALGTQFFNTLGANPAAIGGRMLYVNAGATLELMGRDIMQPNAGLAIAQGGVVTNNGFNRIGPLSLGGGSIYCGTGNAPTYQNYALHGDVTVTGAAASSIIGSLAANPAVHLEKAGGVTFNVANVTLDENPDLIVSAVLADKVNNVGTNGLTKTGSGTMALNGNSTFTGAATINAGTLALGLDGSISNGVVVVSTGGVFDVTAKGTYVPPPASVIQGNGTVTGTLIQADNSGRILPGAAGQPGTLTIKSQVLMGSAYTNYFDLTNNVTIGGGVNDLLTIDSSFFEPSGSPVFILPLVPLTSGTYRLINYTAPVPGSSFGALLGATSRDTWTLDTATAGEVNLIVAAGTNQSLVWSPVTSDVWDIGVTTNWYNTGTLANDAYYDTDGVLFDDSGAATNVVLLNTLVKPQSLTVKSSSNYTITGSGGIADGFGFKSPLVKDGSGTLRLGTVNSFSGGTIVSNGSIVMATNNAMGVGPVVLEAGTVLEDVAGGSLLGPISGAGSVRKTGGSTLTLYSVSTYTGPTVITNGAVVVLGPGRLGGGQYAANIVNDGSMTFNGATQILSGTMSGTGSLALVGAAVNSGALSLINTNTFSGLTTVSAGVLTLASSNGPAIAGSVRADNNISPDIYTTVNNQFGPGAVMTFTNDVGDHVRFELLGTTQTLAGIQTTYQNQRGIIQSREVGPAGNYSNALLILNGSGNYFFNGYLRDSGTIGLNRLGLAKVGTGTQTLRGTVIDYSGPTIIGAGSLVLTNVDDTHSISWAISNSASLVVDTSARTSFQFLKTTTITGGGSIIQLGTNSVWIGATNQGVTMAMDAGALLDVRAGLMRNEMGPFNNWTNNKSSLSISNGASFYITDANTFVDALNGQGTLEKGHNSSHTLTIGTADGSGTFNGVIRNSTGVLHLVKTGIGTQTLGGNNSYSGNTTIAGGTLGLGTSGSITGTPRIILNTGTVFKVPATGTYPLAGLQSLEGSGLVTGSIQTAVGSRIIPGTAGIAGTLTLGNNLSEHAATTNYFDVGGGIASDLLSIGENLEPSNAVIAVNAIAVLTNGTYTLATYGGAKTTSFNPTPVVSAGGLTNNPAGRKTFAIDETVANQINLIVGGTNLTLRWNSAVSANWDLASTNWLDLDGLTNTVFFQQDSVIFDDTPGVVTNVSLVGALAPGSVIINTSTNQFTIGGLGNIAGYATLTKDGTGAAILVSTNTYSGITTINNGTLQIGNGTVNGAFAGGLYNIASPGTLRMVSISATTTKPVWSNIVGTGTLALNTLGTGTGSGDWGLLALSNAFTGTLKVETGRVYTTGTGNWGLGGVTNIVVQGGGHFGMFNIPNGTVAQPLTIAGAGYGEANYESAIRMCNGGFTNTLSGPIALSASATIAAGGVGIVSGVISGSSTSLLTIGTANQAGTVILAATNTYSGGTRFNAGTIVAPLISESGPSSIGNSGDLIFGGGTLRYDDAASIVITRTVTNILVSRTAFDITNSAASVMLGGTIGGTGGWTKLGAGTLVVSNSDVISLMANPGLTVRGGTLLLAASQFNSQNGTTAINNSDYIGQNNFDNATMTLVGSSAYIRSNNFLYVADQTGSKGTFNIQDNARFWGNYRISIAQNAGSTGTVNLSGGSLALGNDIYVGNSGFGTFNHTGGTYTNFGGWTYVGLNAGATGKFYQIDGPAFVSGNLVIGNNANAVGAFYHAGGDLYVGGELGPAWGNGSFGSYGFYQMTGGTVSNGNWVQVGRSGMGVLYMLGGSETHRAPANGFLAGNNVNGNSTGVMYFANCQLDDAGRLCVGWNGSARAEVTIDSGTSFIVGQNGVQFNQAGTTFGVLNLNGGTLITSNVYKNVAGGYSVVNFNGGTLRARNSQILMGAGAGGVGALDAAFVYAGGAIIDSTNLVVSITQPLRAPSGNGVSALPAIGTLPGYAGAPHVNISGGGGTGATAIAQFDYTSGTVTGLLLTSPGTDYTSQPSVTLVGGGMPTNLLGLATIGTNISGDLTKLGSGDLLLNAVNTYTGKTIVSAGYLYGTGSVNSAVTVNNGGAIGPSYLTPVTGTFTVVSSLSITNGGVLSAYMRGTSATIRVTGDFNVAPTTMVQLISLTPATNGTYVLVDYDGSFNGNISDLVLVAIPYGSQGYLANNLANSSLDLVVTNAGTGIKWDGLVDATWKHFGPQNWKTAPGGSPAAYSALDVVTFDDTASANFGVNVTEPVIPASITVSNSANDYAFTGVGNINGGASVTKSGTGTLTIATSNNFVGGTVLNAGTLKLANTTPLGAMTSRVITLNGGVLQLANDSTVVAYSNAIFGSATVVLDRATSGPGITNTLGGFAFVNSATLSVQPGSNVSSGIATLLFNAFPQLGGVLGRTATFDVATNTLVGLTGNLTGFNSSGTLVKEGNGTLMISGGNNYWDAANGNPVYLQRGVLDLRNAQAFGDGTGGTYVYPLHASSNTTLRLALDANTSFLGFGTNVLNGDNAAVVVDRLTPGSGVTHTLNQLAFRSNFTLHVLGGSNITNGNAGLNYTNTMLSGDATINVVNPIAGGTTVMGVVGVIGQATPGRSLTKTGNGTLSLTPPNPCTYSGGTVVNGGTLVLGFSNGTSNYGTIAGALLINTGAIVRSTVDKAFGFAAAASGNVTVITMNSGLLDLASAGGHGGGQTVYMTASEIRSNGGTNSPTSGSFRFLNAGPDPAIYALASPATSVISGRVACDTTGKFGAQDGAADIDLLVTASITDGVGGAPNGLTKTNAGTMAVTASNTYSGVTLVDGGRLLVNNGAGSGTGTNEVDVASGATLGGTGLVAGTVISYGSVAPGMSAGRLTIGKDCIAMGTVDIEIGGLIPGSGYDQLIVSNTAAVTAGTLNVSLINGFTPGTNDTFTIVSAATVSGPFAALGSMAPLPSGFGWKVDYQPTAIILSVTGTPTTTGYDLWAGGITNGLTNYNESATGDGYPNLLKYATGSNPTNADNLAQMNRTTTNGMFALKFNRNTNATDLTLIIEGAFASTNEATWNGIATNIHGSWGATTNYSENTSTDPAGVVVWDTETTATNRFLRLRVTRP